MPPTRAHAIVHYNTIQNTIQIPKNRQKNLEQAPKTYVVTNLESVRIDHLSLSLTVESSLPLTTVSFISPLR